MQNFVLDDDHVLLIGYCLRSENIRLSSEKMTAFVSDIQEDIETFGQDREQINSFRETHDQLRRLWGLAAKERPDRDLLVEAIGDLSSGATAYVNSRFANVRERLLGDKPNQADFKSWAQTAEAEILADVSRLVTAEGAQRVPGRSRGAGNRSRPRTGPVVMGVVRGAATGARRGGRPTNEAKIDLVMHL